MNCFECASQGHANAAVVAICAQCGAATCADHTVSGHASLEVNSPGAVGHRGLPGRRLFCTNCASESTPHQEISLIA